MIKKFLNRSVQYANKFLFTKDDASTFIATIEAQPGTVQEPGTPLSAENFNELQKNCVYSLTATHKVETDNNIYTADLAGIEAFGLFEGMKLQVYIPATNTGGTGRTFLEVKDSNTSVDTVEVYKKKDDGLNIALEVNDIRKGEFVGLKYTGGVFILTKAPLKTDIETNKAAILNNTEQIENLGLKYGGAINHMGNIPYNTDGSYTRVHSFPAPQNFKILKLKIKAIKVGVLDDIFELIVGVDHEGQWRAAKPTIDPSAGTIQATGWNYPEVKAYHFAEEIIIDASNHLGSTALLGVEIIDYSYM